MILTLKLSHSLTQTLLQDLLHLPLTIPMQGWDLIQMLTGKTSNQTSSITRCRVSLKGEEETRYQGMTQIRFQLKKRTTASSLTTSQDTLFQMSSKETKDFNIVIFIKVVRSRKLLLTRAILRCQYLKTIP